MTALRFKALLLLCLMATATVLSHYWRPTIHLAEREPKMSLEAVFPKTFGAWSLDDRMPVQLVSPDVAANLNRIYSQLLTRTYVNATTGERMMLSVAYGGDQSEGTRAHRPEVCYPAQGFQILDNYETVLNLSGQPVKARRLLSRAGSRIEPITYWVTVGDRVATSGTEQKLEQLRFGVRGEIPDGMLVRVSSIDADEAHGYQRQLLFLGDLAGSISAGWRPRIIGSPAS